jgi:putative ABC transport system substrate-binding protein
MPSAARRVALLCLAVLLLAAPRAVAETDRVFRVGALLSATVAEETDAFVDEMRRLGYEEGRNLLFDLRRTKAPRQNAALAAELVALRPAVLLAAGSQQVEALKNATDSIPIVFTWVSDPVGLGLVESLAKPGGYVTGIANFNPELNAKRLQLISEVVPDVARIGFLFDPGNSASVLILNETEAAAATLHRVLVRGPARTAEQVVAILQELVNKEVGALIIGADLVLSTKYDTIIGFATEHRLPTIFFLPRHVRAGGLMSYSVNPADSFRRAAAFVDKILKGAKPADLPVEQPTKVELAVNLKIAHSLGLTIPPSILARADEVIE